MEPLCENVHYRRLATSRTRYVALLAACTALFAGRVLAQAIQFVQTVEVLPPFLAFQGSALPYSVLLPAQLVILGMMVTSTLAVARGSYRREPVRGKLLAWFGALYLAGSLLRLGVGLAMPDAAPWFHAWIPSAFHLVLASFVLVLADCHRRLS